MSVKLYSDSDGNNIVNTENPDLVKNSVNKNADYQSIKTFYLVTNEEPTDVLIEQSINNNFTEIDNLIIDYAINKDNFEELPEWIITALKAARLAPSAVNRQPWRFRIGEKAVTIELDSQEKNENRAKNIDCGIAMLHLEVGALKAGVSGVWQYLGGEKVARFLVD